ncbi:MAG: SRPBCC family protein [Myxococcota bacterium]
MKIVKGIVIAVAALVLSVFVVALLLPAEQHVERSLVINAEPETLYDLVDSFERFNEFSPWFERDPQVKTIIEGPASGVGHTMRWDSEKDDVGKGVQEIIEVDPPRMVKSRLDFGFGEPPTAAWTFERVDGGTKATWSLDSTFESDFIGRYFGVMLDGMVGPDYERGLENLKKTAEADQEKKDAELAQADAAAPPTDVADAPEVPVEEPNPVD